MDLARIAIVRQRRFFSERPSKKKKLRSSAENDKLAGSSAAASVSCRDPPVSDRAEKPGGRRRGVGRVALAPVQQRFAAPGKLPQMRGGHPAGKGGIGKADDFEFGGGIGITLPLRAGQAGQPRPWRGNRAGKGKPRTLFYADAATASVCVLRTGIRWRRRLWTTEDRARNRYGFTGVDPMRTS